MKTTLLWASIFAFLAVSIGAFGAHGLKEKLESLVTTDIFETANKYHFYHAFALFIIAWLQKQYTSIDFMMIMWAFVIGILLFSGSLYVLSVTGKKVLGMITPIGGLFFLFGWGTLFYKIFRN
jgi:uncharacterized membrane protein YgdD (TMEM256/DUF423 family)